MAVMERSTSLLVTSIIILLVFSPTAAGQIRHGHSNLIASASSSNFTSPNYPSNYPRNTDHIWHIIAAMPTEVVVLRVLDFYLEGYSPTCYYDYVTIYDGHTTDYSVLRTLCGMTSTTQITSSGPSMTVVFHSDAGTNHRGFKFGYTSIEKSAACLSATLSASSTVQYLTSPNYPNPYSSDMDCQWPITSSSYSSSRIVLEIMRLDLKGNKPNCTSDYVKIYDGRDTYSSQIQVLCGDMEDGTFESTGSDMTVVFHSVGENSHYKGFKFTYRSQETELGDGSMTDTELVSSVQEYDYVKPYTPLYLSDPLPIGGGNANSPNVVPNPPSYTSDGTVYGSYYVVKYGVGIFGCLVCLICSSTIWRYRKQRPQLHRAPNRNVRDPSTSAGDDNTRPETSLYVQMNGSQSTPNPPAYSSLNDGLPPYTPSGQGHSENDPQRSDVHDHLGWAVPQDSAPLLNDQKPENYHFRGDNLAYSDETMRDHVTGQNTSYSIA